MHIKLRLGLFCVAVQFLSAQITGLATTDDGSVVYFSTTMRPVGSASGYTPKILSLRMGGAPAVFAEREFNGHGPSNPFKLGVPAVSGDGAVVAYTGELLCPPSHDCGSGGAVAAVELYQGDVLSSSGQLLATGGGVVNISRNGRYAVFHSRGDYAGPYSFNGLLTRVDLRTGETSRINTGIVINVPGNQILSTQVTSDGMAFVTGRRRKQVVIFDGNALRTLPLTREAYRFAMDDQGRTLYFETGTGAGAEIALYDVASGWEQSMVSCAEGAWQPSLSRDGSLLLFLSPANFSGQNGRQHVQAFLMRTDGSELRQLTRPEDEVTSAVLSGDGRVAYAATERNQLLRINLIDWTIDEVIPVTPVLSDGSVDGAAGSELQLNGSEFAATDFVANTSPLSTILGGVRILLNGAPVPIAWVTPTQLAVQVPWEAPVGAASLVLETPVKSTLERGTTLNVYRDSLRFLLGPTCQDPDSGKTLPAKVYAIHEDYLSMITACSPAWGGEVIHVYMTGLGPVEPQVPTGVATPAEPASVAVGFPKTCSLGGGDYRGDVEVVSARLAPETVGLYRVDFRIPDGVGTSDGAYLYCQMPAGTASGYLNTRPKP